MATTYTTNANLQKPASGDRGWATPINANADALDGFAAIGSLCGTMNEVPSTTLALKVSAGTFVKSDNSVGVYAGGSITLDASSTVYVWLDGSGTLTKGSAFPTTPHVRVCAAVTGAASITSIADARNPQPLVGI